MARSLEHHSPPDFFVRGPSLFARLVFFAALSLALMATDSRLHYMTEIRQGFMAILHPLQILANAPVNLYNNTSEYLSSHNRLLRENLQLSREALENGAKLQKLQLLEAENERLRQLLGAAMASAQPARLGEVLHMGRNPFTHKITVNLGSRHQIVAGQAVVDQDGIVGQVTRVYPFSSEVTLITDRELSVPVQIERNGLRAIAFGHGRDNTIDLPYLPTNVDIRQGDRLITSGIDGVYPKGLAVAEVVKIESTPDSPFAHIICKPVANIENHRQVLLVNIPETETPVGTAIRQNEPGKNTGNSANLLPKPAKRPARHATH